MIAHVARIADRSRVLGPGVRSVVWVQGCPLSCAGCLAPEALSFAGGEAIETDSLAQRILELSPRVDGVTYSGGEPFAQAEALADLCARLRAERPELSLMSFSGYTRTWLEGRGDIHQRLLLSCLDLLVDGPYVRARHTPLRWRGSANQRIHRLTDRHAAVELLPDASAGLELEVSARGGLAFTGVPPTPDFPATISVSLERHGLELA